MTQRRFFIILAGVLALSLAGNFFLAGLYFGGCRDSQNSYRRADDSLRQSLSEKDREILRRDMETNRPRFRQVKEELQTAREKVEQAMRAEPLDQQALDAALTEQENAEEAMRGLVREVRKDTAGKLSPEGRSAFARHVREKDESRFRRPSGFDREQRNREAPAR